MAKVNPFGFSTKYTDTVTDLVGNGSLWVKLITEFRRCGCDPDGVVRMLGVDGYPGSDDPGLYDGYAPHTLICCTPEGVQWEEVCALRARGQMNAEKCDSHRREYKTHPPIHLQIICANLRHLRLKHT